MLSFMVGYTSMGFLSVLIFFALGIVVTMVAQSSAATFAITLIMCSQGWISFSLGCAIILGGNIGTTITPILASLSGNVAAKRTAMGHLLFNLFGSIVVLAIFYPFVDLVADITRFFCGINPLDISEAQEAGMRGTTLLNGKGGFTAVAQGCIAFGLAMFPDGVQCLQPAYNDMVHQAVRARGDMDGAYSPQGRGGGILAQVHRARSAIGFRTGNTSRRRRRRSWYMPAE